MVCKFSGQSTAEVVKLVDALDSKSSIRKNVWVRSPPSVQNSFILKGFFLNYNFKDQYA